MTSRLLRPRREKLERIDVRLPPSVIIRIRNLGGNFSEVFRTVLERGLMQAERSL